VSLNFFVFGFVYTIQVESLNGDVTIHFSAISTETVFIMAILLLAFQG